MTEAAVSAAMRTQIRGKIDDIAREEGVTILLAIESGSRAWGFHSPDSDYDVRFIYAQPIDWHLTVAPGRDVIERPISDDLDISGWDLRKSLGLILKSNAVALEWAQSPIIYTEEPGFREAFLSFARQVLRRQPVMWHYLRLAERQAERLRDESGAVKLKRYFYVIRPVLALRWLRLRTDRADPPMDMAALLGGADLPAPVVAEIAALIERKASVKEMGVTAETPEPVDALIAAEIDAARIALGEAAPQPRPSNRAAADAFLRDWTRRTDGQHL